MPNSLVSQKNTGKNFSDLWGYIILKLTHLSGPLADGKLKIRGLSDLLRLRRHGDC